MSKVTRQTSAGERILFVKTTEFAGGGVFTVMMWPRNGDVTQGMQRSQFKEFAQQNWRLLSVFALALVVALWFAVQFVMNFLYFHDPRNVDVDLKGWMTPRYVVMTYDLPRGLVAEILGLTDISQRNRRLRRIADEKGLTMRELTELVRAEAAAYREGQE